jgi:pSer/pThr/pTyr-binding forkhead associated (FHA) protein
VTGARLVWTPTDGRPEVAFELEPGRAHVVGRDEDADVRVDEPLVSRHHARLEPRDAGWTVVDLGSTNHTRVNGEVVTQRALDHGDEVRFARAVCRFEQGTD